MKERIEKRRKAEKTRDPVASLPTPERMAKAGFNFQIGGDDRTGKVLRLTDAPIEQMWNRGAIEGKEYAALQKYRHHWYHAGLQPAVGSVDLNRIFAADPLSTSGMPKSEAQAHHRSQYRQASQLLGQTSCATVDRVVCYEWSLVQAGYKIGYQSPFRAREYASSILRDAGYRLSRFWGIG